MLAAMNTGSVSELVPVMPRAGLHRIVLADGRAAILKHRRDVPSDFFAAEARGLAELAAAGGLRVPALYAVSDVAIVLEDLGISRPANGYYERAGRGLATQHRARSQRFGLDRDGWCGDNRQDNAWVDDGHRFFAERRLLAQGRQALDNGRLQTADLRRIELLCQRLASLLPAQPPVLLHGDLWSGNLHCCGDGEPALIDAGAVHYGWAEADLAMLVLFGAPPPEFFAAYRDLAPLAPDWLERAPLYNLYHLLNHLNLFGSGYLGGVRSVLDRYT